MKKYRISNIDKEDVASKSIVITHEDVVNFGNLTKDMNPLHMNLKYGKSTRFENINVQGSLLSSYIIGVVGSKLPGEGWMCLGVDSTFNLPVFPGELVNIIVSVDKIVKSIGVVILDGKMINKEGLVVCRSKIKAKEL
jgi:3-hydroxybutyryl-CoA dehydratase